MSTTASTLLWLLWVAQFWALEGPALFYKDYETTLTAHVRDWASMRNKAPGWVARRATLVMFLGWLVWHFMSGVLS